MKSKFIIGLILAGCWFPAAAQQSQGEEIIHQMYKRYHQNWYAYLTFSQQTISYKDGKVSGKETWFEALGIPGHLTIKFDSLKSGSGIIFRQDTQYVFKQNKMIQQTPRVHELLVLGFDVYKQAPSQTIAKLKAQGFDFTKSYETDWQGRPVLVVGASGKTDNSPQFWIDKNRLYFVRLLQQHSKTGQLQETQFNDYKKVGGGWVAAEVLFSVGGKPRVKEVYSDIEERNHLDDSIFDTRNFQQASW